MKRDNLILTVIIALAFLARLAGSWYGYPFALGLFDENISIRQAMAFGVTRSLRPLSFLYPALYSYLLLAVYTLYYFLGKAAGWFAYSEDFAFLYLTKPFVFFFIARLISVVCGSATVFITFLTARRVYDFKTGLWAAWLLAMAQTHIIHSHWAKPDILMVFLVSLSLLFTGLILTEGRMRNYLFAGLFLGLATATKYNAAFLSVSIVVAHLLTAGKSRFLDWRLAGYFLMLLMGFFVGSPYCLIDFNSCYKGLMVVSDYLRFGSPADINTLSAGQTVSAFMRENPVFGWVSVCGLVYCFLRREKRDSVFLVPILAFILFVLRYPRANAYYLLPVFPAMAVVGARFLSWITGKKFAAGLGLMVAGLSVFSVFAVERDFLTEDSRIPAKAWIERHIPAQSRIALYCLRYKDGPPIVSYGTEFSSLDYGPKAKVQYSSARLKELLDDYYAHRQTYRIYKLEKDIADGENGAPAKGGPYCRRYYQQGFKGIAELKREKIEYLILSSFLYGLYEDKPLPGQPLYAFYLRNKEYFAKLMHSKELFLLKEFSSEGSLSPAIRIYKLVY
ncbi:MAG: ArnT family glycosyltransferase [Candidatus Omnitrophota bacterium]